MPTRMEDGADGHADPARDRGRSMTLRQRPASGSAAVVVSADPSPVNGSANGDAAGFRWEAWFAGASADQRAEALNLARQQGLVYLQQLPPLSPRAAHA